MTIFYYLLKIIKGIGFIFILIGGSYVCTSLIYYSRDEKQELNYIELYDTENIEVENIRNSKYIQIDMRINGSYIDDYLIAYALTYYDNYKKETYLYIDKENIMVVVGEGGIGVIKRG